MYPLLLCNIEYVDTTPLLLDCTHQGQSFELSRRPYGPGREGSDGASCVEPLPRTREPRGNEELRVKDNLRVVETMRNGCGWGLEEVRSIVTKGKSVNRDVSPPF